MTFLFQLLYGIKTLISCLLYYPIFCVMFWNDQKRNLCVLSKQNDSTLPKRFNGFQSKMFRTFILQEILTFQLFVLIWTKARFNASGFSAEWKLHSRPGSASSWGWDLFVCGVIIPKELVEAPLLGFLRSRLGVIRAPGGRLAEIESRDGRELWLSLHLPPWSTNLLSFE